MASIRIHSTAPRSRQCAAACLRRGQRRQLAGDFEAAVRAYRSSVRLARQSRPAAPRLLAQSLLRLGLVLRLLGRCEAALRTLREAVMRTERAFVAEGLPLAEALNQLGLCFKQLHRYADAGPLFQRALAIVERRHGQGHRAAAAIFHSFAELECAAQNWARGEPFAREGLRIRTRTMGRRHPLVAADLIALAALLVGQKRYAESRQLCRRASDIYTRALGSRHPEIAAAMETALHRRRRDVAHHVERLTPTGDAVTATINPLEAPFRLRVARSPVHRFGVFAGQAIPAGELVIKYCGMQVSHARRIRIPRASRSYFFKHDDNLYVDGAIGGSGAELINHSCEPNLVARPRGGAPHFFSTRPIRRDEELTLDYKFPVDAPSPPCRCGARTCRGTMNRPRQVRTDGAYTPCR